MSRGRSPRAQTKVARESTRRTLTDPREMRALAHPVRLALLEALTREGPLTATEAAEIVDESPANCSFHLRTLAKYGFVEEVGGVRGRSRPWRRVALGQSFSESQEDPAASVAAGALADLAHERTFQRIHDYRVNRDRFGKSWRDSAFSSDFIVYVTPEELREVNEQMLAILERFAGRTLDIEQRPPDAKPVQLATFGTPLLPTPSGN